jgi:protein TonB
MTRNIIEGKAPNYPPEAKKANIDGRVVLEAMISSAGEVEELCVSQGPEVLRQPSLDAAKKWKYKPFTLNGEPQEVKTIIIVEFVIGDGR